MAKPPLNIKISTHAKDLGLSHIKKEMAKLDKKPFVKIGIQGKSAAEVKTGTDVSLVLVATAHEYGIPSRGIPERSYIRKTVNENQSKYDQLAAQLKDKIMDASQGFTTEKALNLIGMTVQSDIQKTIQGNNAGLNGPTPLKYRDGTPLFDTGQLNRSILYVREMNGGSK